MEGGGSIVNLGELSKPATVLVEKIAEAVGGYFKPYQIRRVAGAEADADQIRAEAQLEISDLQRRALQRFVAEEGKKQENIESIASQALPGVQEDARPEEMENDWVTNFFDKARLISDDEMQQLWVKVLSGEANAPGRFSKRTVDYLASLDGEDARLFQSLLGFGYMMGNIQPLIYDVRAQLYNERDITFDSLTHLDEIGLLSFDNLTGFVRLKLPKKLRVFYYGMPIELEAEKDENTLPIGKVLLSRVGQQLAPIVDCQPVEGFVDYVTEEWAKSGFTATQLGPEEDGNGS